MRAAFLATFLLCLATSAGAQELPRGSVSAGVSFLHASPDPVEVDTGVSVQAAGRIGKSPFSVVFQFTNDRTGVTVFDSLVDKTVRETSSRQGLLGGVRLSSRRNTTLFAQVLIGVALEQKFEDHCCDTVDFRSRRQFLFQPGAGVDIALTKRHGVQFMGELSRIASRERRNETVRLLRFTTSWLVLLDPPEPPDPTPEPREALTGRSYVSGGAGIAWRYPGDKQPNAIPDERTATPTFSIAAGYKVGRLASVEGVLGFTGAQPIIPDPWFYTYSLTRDVRTTSRDVPMLGMVRITPACSWRLCVEPVIGGGVTFHAAHSETLAYCAQDDYGLPREGQTCTPPTRPDEKTDGSFEFTFAVGVDAPVRVSNRVSIGPSFRVMMIKRREYLTSYTHRGPNGTGAIVPSLGVNLTWHSR
jgi:hypothetical protein